MGGKAVSLLLVADGGEKDNSSGDWPLGDLRVESPTPVYTVDQVGPGVPKSRDFTAY
jgi:hypothetical protein